MFSLILVLTAVAAVIAVLLGLSLHREFLVREGLVGLLSRAGRHVETLGPGRHTRWGRHLEIRLVDVRALLFQVPGQEVLTADHVQIKLSLMLTIRVTDPVCALLQVDNYIAHLHAAVQSAARAAIAAVPLEELLSRRFALGDGLRTELAPATAKLGLEVQSVELRDVMLPAELRKSFAEVLQARQAGQAALERARGESAALRNLANAARLLEAQPALATLRFLQTLEASALRPKIVLSDLQSMFGQLSKSSDAPR